ncbi:MAG: hypothetical protein OXF73_12755 [Gammaproteobacteria bacterium]|nr:hypothetical protein [Gammaproteobacteria bacterium]MCY4226337.1 hypothetical protein [Gammaproteobacteria bacterium]
MQTSKGKSSKFAKKLALSFHEQFAQNQNHHQAMFVQVLAVLVTVLVGFGYAYSHLQNGSSDGDKMQPDLLYASFAISMVLLSLAIALIANMAYGFRRDQATAGRIRVIFGAMKARNGNEDDRAYFPLAYNPFGKAGINGFFWMPGYHSIFYFALIAVKFILILIVINQAFFGIDHQGKYHFLSCVSIMVFAISLYSDFLVLTRYRRKWKKFLKKNKAVLQAKPKAGNP